MGNWVRADYQFGDHFTVFCIPARRNDLWGAALDTLLNGLGTEPEKLESFLYDMVVRERPELAGCVVWSLNFCAKRCAWEIAVSHASLMRVRCGDESTPEWLCDPRQ